MMMSLISVTHCKTCKATGFKGREVIDGKDGVRKVVDKKCPDCNGTGHIVTTTEAD